MFVLIHPSFRNWTIHLDPVVRLRAPESPVRASIRLAVQSSQSLLQTMIRRVQQTRRSLRIPAGTVLSRPCPIQKRSFRASQILAGIGSQKPSSTEACLVVESFFRIADDSTSGSQWQDGIQAPQHCRSRPSRDVHSNMSGYRVAGRGVWITLIS